jgi:hypothetical protein
MTPAELKAWRDRLGLTNREAADKLALSLQGFLDQMYGHRQPSRRTAAMAELVEKQEQNHGQD